jgi:hypothetical protein
MSKIKLALLGVLAVVAMSTIASASASAFSFLVGGKTVAAGEAFSGTSEGGTAVLEMTGVAVTCNTSHGIFSILSGGLSHYHILYKTCTVSKVLNCSVAEPILVLGLSQLTLLNNVLAKEFKGVKAGEEFVTLTFSNNGGECAIAGPQSIKGVAVGTVSTGETEALTGELTFTNTSGTKLELGGVAAKYKDKQKLRLNGDQKWAVMMA